MLLVRVRKSPYKGRTYEAKYGNGRPSYGFDPIKAALNAIRTSINRQSPPQLHKNHDGEWIGARQESMSPISAHRARLISEDMESNSITSRIEILDASETGV